jgi:spermidine synthase
VLGVFATGFLLLEMFGVWRTTLIAVTLNIVIGIAAIILGRKYLVVAPRDVQDEAEDRQSVEIAEPLPTNVLRLVLITYMLSGFIALAYQVCWTRSLIFSFDRLKSTTYSFSGMLVVFLLGLAIGSTLMQAIVDRQKNLLRLYGLLQAGIGLSGGLSFYMILRDWPVRPEAMEDGTLIYWNAVLNVMTTTAVAIGLPTLLMGMAFPVVSKIVVGSIRKLSMDVSKVYALNTVGAILGSFASGFILIPLLGIKATLALLSGGNLLIAAALFWMNPRLQHKSRMIYGVAALLAAVLIPARILSGTNFFQRLQPNEKMVYYEEGALATVSVIENNSRDRMIYVDGVGVAGTDKIMLTDQKSLAHVPMMLLGGKADKVLSVGFGSGGASYSYTLYENINEINTIEIAPEVLRAAPSLTDSNHGIIATEDLIQRAKTAGATNITGFRNPVSAYTHEPLAGFRTFDPRFKVIVEDARSYLRFTDKKFDVIATDCTDLRYKTNANLYDLEYFQLCRDALTDRGLVVVWMPLAGLSDRAFRTALHTFEEVFPEMSEWYFTNQPTHYCLLIGGKGAVRVDYEQMVAATALPLISDDLKEIGLRDPDKLISSFVCDERTLAAHLEGYPLNTEDNPIIEFESPRYGYGSMPIYENQKKLYDIQVPAADLLTNLPGDQVRDRIWTLQQANEIVFEGHHQYRLYNFVDAVRLYQKALAMVPFDESIRELLDFAELRRHYETAMVDPELQYSLNTFWIAHSVFLEQERYMDAATIAEQASSRLPTQIPQSEEGERWREVAYAINARLVETYAKAGRPKRAEQYLERVSRYTLRDQDLADLRKLIEQAEKNE